MIPTLWWACASPPFVDDDSSPGEDTASEATPLEPIGDAAMPFLALRLLIATHDGVVTSFSLPSGETFDPSLTVGWFPDTEGRDSFDGSCWMELSLAGASVTVQQPDPHPYRLQVPAREPILTVCPGSVFDRSQFPNSDPVRGTLPPDVPWTFEWGGPTDPELATVLSDDDLGDLATLVGASVTSPLVSDALSDLMYLRPVVLDEGQVVFDDDGIVLVPPDEVSAGDGTVPDLAWFFNAPWFAEP
ncbi:MAG: hypothetical protein AAF211_13845 [Myxococcota bacterium]